MQPTSGSGAFAAAGLVGGRGGPYEQWQAKEGVPVYKSYYVTDMYNLELGDWPRKGGKGAYLNLANQYEDDGMIVEIPPGDSSTPSTTCTRR